MPIPIAYLRGSVLSPYPAASKYFWGVYRNAVFPENLIKKCVDKINPQCQWGIDIFIENYFRSGRILLSRLFSASTQFLS